MDKGKIWVAECDGTFLIKMVGDVRVTLCASLNRYIESIFAKGQGAARKVLVDLLSAQGLDSTTLGLLVKLALHCQRELGIRPVIFCQDESLLRTLEVMAIDELFTVIREGAQECAELAELPPVAASEEELRLQVLAAHRLLIEINPRCEADFTDLIRSLEKAVSS